jgi:membrane protein YqaA with SNARE-associated domain
VQIRAGSAHSLRGGKVYKSTKFFLHPKFNKRSLEYNVGVIITPEEMTLDGKTTKAITLVDAGVPVKPKTILMASGWGGHFVSFIIILIVICRYLLKLLCNK